MREAAQMRLGITRRLRRWRVEVLAEELMEKTEMALSSVVMRTMCLPLLVVRMWLIVGGGIVLAGGLGLRRSPFARSVVMEMESGEERVESGWVGETLRRFACGSSGDGESVPLAEVEIGTGSKVVTLPLCISIPYSFGPAAARKISDPSKHVAWNGCSGDMCAVLGDEEISLAARELDSVGDGSRQVRVSWAPKTVAARKGGSKVA